MSRQVVLLRVGIDAGCGGIQGPLFQDGTFELMCIPDDKGVSDDTYGNLTCKAGRPLTDYFPESRQKRMFDQHVHMDPEFATFTYGDPTAPKRSLQRLKPGDLLVFYCGLQEWNETDGWNSKHRPALYLAGYFVVSRAGIATEFSTEVLNSEFGANFHVSHRSLFETQKEHLILVEGGSGSRHFRKAHQISAEAVDKAGTSLKVLSSEMQKVFGSFGGVNSIQRSPPRWVDSAFVETATKYLLQLE